MNYVNIQQTPASIGHRMLAFMIDSVVFYFYCALFYGVMESVSTHYSNDVQMTVACIMLLIAFLYEIVSEQVMGGTIGKISLGMRVIMIDGEAVGIGSSVLRRLLYIIDSTGIGLVVMLCNRRNQRLGDLAAGTVVVRERSSKQHINSLKVFTYLNPDYTPKYAFAAELTWGQVDFIRQTMDSPFAAASHAYQRKNIVRLANYLANRYHTAIPEGISANRFLRTVVDDYNYYTWMEKE